MNVHSVSLKGRRDSNEDKHNIVLNENSKNPDMLPINFFSIFDGHGGKFVSKFLSDNLPKFFINKNVTYPLTKKYIYDVYDGLQNQLKKDHISESLNCGSTSLVLIYYKRSKDNTNYINVLNTGDSRCVICRDNLAYPLTKDHKPSWPEEKHRIQSLGGNIYFDGDDYRIKDLSVSRAFGDVKAEPFVTYTPDIFRLKLEKNDKFIVMACDGLWDKLSNQDVVNYILNECYDNTTNNRINKNINIAKKLGEYAIYKGSTDNITIIIIFLNQADTQQNAAE